VSVADLPLDAGLVAQAEAEAQQGQLDAALARLGRWALEDMPAHVALLAARCLLRRPDPLGAIAYLEYAALPRHSRHEAADAHRLLGQLRSGFGEELVAAEHYRAALALQFNQPELRHLLARALLRAGWPDLALRQLALHGRRLPGAWRETSREAKRAMAAARAEAAERLSTWRRAGPPAPAAASALVQALLRAGRLKAAAGVLARCPPAPALRWMAAWLRLRQRQGVLDDGLRRALRPPQGCDPALRREAMRVLLLIGAVEDATAVLASLEGAALDPPAEATRARLLLLRGEAAALAALAAPALAARPRHGETARQLLTARVLLGQIPVWHHGAAGPPLRVPLLQFWPDGAPPPDVAAAMQGWVARHPGLPLARFDAASAREFVAAQLGEQGRIALDACTGPVMQADLLRTVFLATQGGLWVETGAQCLGPLDALLARLPEAQLVAPMVDDLPYWARSSLMAAPPGSAVAARVLAQMLPPLLRAARGRGEVQPWPTTGPGLLTRILAGAEEPVALLDPAFHRSLAGRLSGAPAEGG
jgi:hypothetical protein